MKKKDYKYYYDLVDRVEIEDKLGRSGRVTGLIVIANTNILVVIRTIVVVAVLLLLILFVYLFFVANRR